MSSYATLPTHLLECRNVSFVSTVNEGPWYNRIFSPPIVAQFLKEVSLEAYSGQIHAIMGVSGCGKTTLLDAICSTGSGDTAGTIQLDRQILSRYRFNQLCSYVTFGVKYPGFLSVRNLLYYTARLSLGRSVSLTETNQRVLSVMKDFEILGYGHKRLDALSESARRRTMVAIALIKDPILLVIDDPTRDLEPLMSYQLMYCLKTFASRYNRIVLVSIRNPRSDIYQLLERVTIIFYGEVLYSGNTRNLPNYFKTAGFPCPNNENPATYYLSIATVDRETTARYVETQDQAVRLVEYFKNYSSSSQCEDNSKSDVYANARSTALCHLEKKLMTQKFYILMRRSLISISSTPTSLILRISALPAASLFLSLFSVNLLSGSWSIPHSASGIFQITNTIFYMMATFLTHLAYSPLRTLSFHESFEGLYGQMWSALGYLTVVTVVDILSIFISTALIMWLSNLTLSLVILRTSFLLLATFFHAQFITMTCMMYISDSLNCTGLAITIMFLWILLGGGLARSFSTIPSDWLLYMTYINPMRYMNYLLSLDIFSRLPISMCTRTERSEVDHSPTEKFCRWPNSTIFFDEIYPSSFQPSDYWSSAILLLFFTLSLFVVMLFSHYLPKPRHVINKFRCVNITK